MTRGVLLLVPTLFEAGLLFGAAGREALSGATLAEVEVRGRRAAAVCGFGLAAAGAGAAHALAAYRDAHGGRRPERAILAGIAGTYRPRIAPPGSAILATHARCHGIGAGSGRRHLGAEQIGWAQGVARPGLPALSDQAALVVPDGVDACRGGLLSVTAASGSPHDALMRRRRFPDALAEEMEAFAVALAARLEQVPLTVIRGISNVAGVRDTAAWRSSEAIASTRALLERVLTTLEETKAEA